MEYRKLISFGKNSFVVSLPKNWVRKNKLVKGDLLYIDEDSSSLVVYPRPKPEPEEKEIKIDVDGKDFRRIQREIVSAYIQNNRTITLSGEEIKKKAKDIQQFIQNLIALEILEQDSKKIVTKDFLNLTDISMEQIIKKMDIITRSMLKDCKEMFGEDNFDSIYHRDNDVNKFRFLIYRIIWYAMENPSAVMKKLKMNTKDLFTYWWLAFIIEAIADHTKRIARYMQRIKLPEKEKKIFIELMGKIETMYLDIIKAYHSEDIEAAHRILHERFEIIEFCDDFFKRNRETNNIGYLIYNTKSLIVTIHSIGRIVYEGMPG